MGFSLKSQTEVVEDPSPRNRCFAFDLRSLRSEHLRQAFASFQLHGCHILDYRLKGYRPPNSRLTSDLSDAHLAYYNFEWLTSSCHSLGRTTPGLENSIVKIPIHWDDFDLYTGKLSFGDWTARAVALIQQSDFTAIGLHACYAGLWLQGYAELLRSIGGMSTFLTFDEVAARVFLCNGL